MNRVGRRTRHGDGVPPQGAVNPGVARGSTILFGSLAELQYSEQNMFDTWHYGRLGGPTQWAFEEAIADVEGGFRAITASSGLSIIATALMAYAKSGSHILVPHNVYGGVRRFCDNVLASFGVSTEFYRAGDGAALRTSIRANTALIYVESPGTTDLAVVDLPSIVDEANKQRIPVIVDNTWATPLFYKPLAHGAAVSLHSASKYILGHSDAFLGVAICTQQSWPVLQQMAFCKGDYASPDDAYLALRGLRTLSVRLERHQRSAVLVAGWLALQPQVKRVFYPALAGDPGHVLWKRDYAGASGRFAVELNAVDPAALAAMLDNLQCFALGFGWGGLESIIAPVVSPDPRVAPMLRLAIGLEDPKCLIEDLRHGLRRLDEASKKS